MSVNKIRNLGRPGHTLRQLIHTENARKLAGASHSELVGALIACAGQDEAEDLINNAVCVSAAIESLIDKAHAKCKVIDLITAVYDEKIREAHDIVRCARGGNIYPIVDFLVRQRSVDRVLAMLEDNSGQ